MSNNEADAVASIHRPVAETGGGAFRHPRLLPARPDLAAASLRGAVQAERFVEGQRRRVAVGALDLKREPRANSSLDTQLLHGETVQVYDENEGWAWVQAERDGYVGYVASHALDEVTDEASHEVAVNRTFVYPAPDMKQAAVDALPLAGRVTVVEERGPFAKLAQGGFVWRSHLRHLAETHVGDLVTTAENLLGTPYLWGGRTPQGLDCSGLVQLSFGMAGVAMPRDASMQEGVGRALPSDGACSDLQRGDLVFWPGHVGLMADADRLIHASGHHMLVCIEPLRTADDRIRAKQPPHRISSRRRAI